MSPKLLRENFHNWLAAKGIDISQARYRSAPINYDCRGLQFGNIFLVGEAGGFASGLTGEGIYQALVTGEEAAKIILGATDPSDAYKYILRYNRIQEKIIKMLHGSGPLRGTLQELIVMLLNNRLFRAKTHRSFS
jgi:geranylgeranyl reductase